ncbi:putative secondary alcohol dehydrogenase protein [Hirsutella rhossiliensis]|uniref:Secondary alcohol dehydrogenase protein n=1 Tax=Hirsutella rhossiliensis TaxID=111463 RepID=A0A9P8MY61_9HYPO|nr:putative secondary alcohol dehydrogenase protein [Hirsutella rhossiliensis]KAH0963405.1 putative secondary alcohol dehydrogenase protein [Hirsutella rhossiliensis]
MSSADTRPISPARFAAALKDLSPSMLHLKALEIRNSVAHLQYSNDQLRPFAEGSVAPTTDESTSGGGQPDQDCVDAIRENEVVIDRMAERVALIRAEVEQRGLSWAEFQDVDERRDMAEAKQANGDGGAARDAPETGRHAAWSDGTFQTGSIRGGQVHLDGPPGAQAGTAGGSLSDEQLRQAVEEQLRNLGHDDDGGGDDGDGGVHL